MISEYISYLCYFLLLGLGMFLLYITEERNDFKVPPSSSSNEKDPSSWFNFNFSELCLIPVDFVSHNEHRTIPKPPPDFSSMYTCPFLQARIAAGRCVKPMPSPPKGKWKYVEEPYNYRRYCFVLNTPEENIPPHDDWDVKDWVASPQEKELIRLRDLLEENMLANVHLLPTRGKLTPYHPDRILPRLGQIRYDLRVLREKAAAR